MTDKPENKDNAMYLRGKNEKKQSTRSNETVSRAEGMNKVG